MKKRNVVFASLIALSLTAAGPLLAQSNTDAGVWKLNVAKSKYVPGPGSRSQTRTVVPQGSGWKVTIEGVSGAGKTINYSYTTNYDGQDSPLSGVGFPSGADTIAIKRIDANTTTQAHKKDGKVITLGTRVVSKDGRVETIHAKGKDPDGKSIDNLVIYEKQ